MSERRAVVYLRTGDGDEPDRRAQHEAVKRWAEASDVKLVSVHVDEIKDELGVHRPALESAIEKGRSSMANILVAGSRERLSSIPSVSDAILRNALSVGMVVATAEEFLPTYERRRLAAKKAHRR